MKKRSAVHPEAAKLVKLTPLMIITFTRLARHNPKLFLQNLTQQQVKFLMMLHHIGPRRLSEISKIAAITPGTMTTGIKKLLNKGLVIKQQDPADKRVSYLSLSVKGEAIVRSVLKGFTSLLNSMCDDLTAGEKKKLIDSYEFILKTYDKFLEGL